MAKQNEQLDRFFREKLEDHQEKPSILAWDRLESQLPASQSFNRGIWWAVAASASVLLIASWFLWRNNGELAPEQLLAEEGNPTGELTSTQESTQQTENQTKIFGEISKEQPKQDSTPASQTPPKPQTITPQSTLPQLPKTTFEQKPQDTMVAEAEISQPEIQIHTPAIDLEIHEVELPKTQPVTIHKAVAEAKTAEDDAPIYRVNIYSDGLKKGIEPEKNIITEVGKTVGKVEGLLGKVDEGFAELQDKKNSLFASLTFRKQASE